MENRKDPVKSKALALAEKLPAQLSAAHSTSGALSVSNHAYPVLNSSHGNSPLPQYRSWEWETAQNEKPVKILSYVGSMPNQFGNDGDFYVDEMTNMLYGPKEGGAWPETGVLAAGLCKRTWIAFTRMRVPSKLPERGFFSRIKSMFRLLLPLKTLFRASREKSPG